jgi:hypothetical protein
VTDGLRFLNFSSQQQNWNSKIDVSIDGLGMVSLGSIPRNQNFFFSSLSSCRSLKKRVKKFECQFKVVGQFKNK